MNVVVVGGPRTKDDVVSVVVPRSPEADVEVNPLRDDVGSVVALPAPVIVGGGGLPRTDGVVDVVPSLQVGIDVGGGSLRTDGVAVAAPRRSNEWNQINHTTTTLKIQ